MAIRFDDEARVMTLAVRDLSETVSPSGHLVGQVAQSRRARMALGREIHERWQASQASASSAYTAEVKLEQALDVGGWEVRIQGRVDGLLTEGDYTVVEEIKSTALDGGRLMATSLDDWPSYTAQLELYLWMLESLGYPAPQGRLVLISVLDGAHHVLGMADRHERIDAWVRERLTTWVAMRERRLAWYAERRARTVPLPFPAWREGQATIEQAVRAGLQEGQRLLVQAPTGLGKTAAVLRGALAHAMAHDQQVFWATSRNTQQAGVVATLRRFVDAGLPVSWVAMRSKERTCLNDVVACRPDTCRFANRYYDKVQEHDLVRQQVDAGRLEPDEAMALGQAHEVCPFELLNDVSEHVDVVVGDVNYALSPHGQLKRHFGEQHASDWVLVVDEAHQLVDRARGHASPSISAKALRHAHDRLCERDAERFGPFLDLCRDALGALLEVVDNTPGPYRDGWAVAELSLGPWRDLAGRVDALALDYALLRTRLDLPEGQDPWTELAWEILRFAQGLEEATEATVALAQIRTGEERVKLLCLDPSDHLRPMIARLGGWVGCSATLSPPGFYRDLLGLPEDTRHLDVPSPFPSERRPVWVAPRISTAWKDRAREAEPTTAMLQGIALATPGNTALYFPSFAMLEDLVGRLDLPDHTLLVQTRGMSDEERNTWLETLATSEQPVLLAAVLGGIFAEGIDLPPGALSTLVVVGPALPPIGLERDLLRAHYDAQFGEGFLYASLVPGMTKVIQAAGRLVRRPEDRGVVVLLGRRFRWRDHVRLLPDAWKSEVPDDPVAAVHRFWHGRA